MFGNWQGWSISGVMIAVTAALLMWVNVQEQLTAPTALSQKGANLGLLSLPGDPLDVLPELRDGVDCASHYRVAITWAVAHREELDEFLQSPTIARFEFLLPAINEIVAARHDGAIRLFIDEPDKAINFSGRPELAATIDLGRATYQGALLLSRSTTETDSQKSDAIALAEASLSLGVKLFRERINAEELFGAAELIQNSAWLLAQLDPKRTEPAKSLALATQQSFKDHITPLATILTSLDVNVLNRHAGDYFEFARGALDRVWRVEACLALGRLKFTAARGSDRAGAVRALRRLAQSADDPIVRFAAKTALDMSVETFRSMR